MTRTEFRTTYDVILMMSLLGRNFTLQLLGRPREEVRARRKIPENVPHLREQQVGADSAVRRVTWDPELWTSTRAKALPVEISAGRQQAVPLETIGKVMLGPKHHWLTWESLDSGERPPGSWEWDQMQFEDCPCMTVFWEREGSEVLVWGHERTGI